MKKLLIFFLILSFLIVSCRELLFNDESGTRRIDLDNFHAVDVSGIFNLVLIQDSSDMLEISGKNNIGSIDAYSNNDTLIIRDPHIKSFNPYKNTLRLHFTDIKYLITRDPVTLTCHDTIRAATLSYDAIGEIAEVRLKVVCNTLIVVNSANTLGFFHLSGKASLTSYFNRYGCSIFADSLTVQNAVVRNESIGEVRVNTSENLTAYINGPGNIFYFGDPVVTIAEKKGDGRVIKIQ
ncbi:MAG TPA: DUF2807 domain-containing protein [Bacteroidales bacterium]|nr:DUF2807 domain-containing protein [Bacteroidales bacterium]